MDEEKQRYADRVQAVLTQVAIAARDSRELYSIWFDRGYNDGGSNPIVDADLAGLTAAQLTSGVTLLEALLAFVDNGAVAQADRGAVLNVLRTDV
jgi:hypothetical protein